LRHSFSWAFSGQDAWHLAHQHLVHQKVAERATTNHEAKALIEGRNPTCVAEAAAQHLLEIFVATKPQLATAESKSWEQAAAD
jgi:hypothetical protein